MSADAPCCDREEAPEPHLQSPVLLRAWRMNGETGKIHYMAKRADGTERHLVAKSDHALYEVLDSHLLAQGYTGPKSGQADEAEGQPEA